MESSLTSSRALWIVLGLCAIVAILAPFFVSTPKTPAVANPIVAKIRAESETLSPWFTLYDEATALRAELERPDSGSGNEQLEAFSEKTSAERAFGDWVRKHRPPTLEAVNQDARGSELLRSYRDALVKSHRAREKQQAIKKAKHQLIDVIQQIRAGIVAKHTDSDAIDSICVRFQTLRDSVTDGAADLPAIEKTVDAEISREFQQLRETSS